MIQENKSFFTIIPSYISLLFLFAVLKLLSISPCLISISLLKKSKYTAERVGPNQTEYSIFFAPHKDFPYSPQSIWTSFSLTACYPLVQSFILRS